MHSTIHHELLNLEAGWEFFSKKLLIAVATIMMMMIEILEVAWGCSWMVMRKATTGWKIVAVFSVENTKKPRYLVVYGGFVEGMLTKIVWEIVVAIVKHAWDFLVGIAKTGWISATTLSEVAVAMQAFLGAIAAASFLVSSELWVVPRRQMAASAQPWKT